MKYFVQGRLPHVTPPAPRNIGPVTVHTESFDYSNDTAGDWRDDAQRIEMSFRRTLGLAWDLWTAPERTSVRQDTPTGPSLETYLPMTTTVVEPLTSVPIVDPDICYQAILDADDETSTLLSLYMDALGSRSPRGGDHFRAWAFALIIDAWNDGEGAWDQRCKALVERLNSSGYPVLVTGGELGRLRHAALKYRNWVTADQSAQDIRQLRHVARGYLLLRLGLVGQS